MAIQFGYVTMFAAVAPWATTLCMLNNVIERKSDALRMLYESQRPRWQGAQDIGAWYGIFEFLCFSAILTNMALLGLTSSALTAFYGLEGWHLAGFVIGLEHVLVLLKLGVAARIPDAPLWVLKAQAYEAWIKRRGEARAAGARDLEALQEEYDDESELERVWM